MENNQNLETQNTVKREFTLVQKIIVSVLFLILAYTAGHRAGSQGLTFQPKTFEVINKQDQPKVVDYDLLWKAIGIIDSKYIDKPADQQKLLYGAVAGAVASLGDPYSSFFPPKDLTNFKTQLAGSFGGIGAEVGLKNGNILIVAPLDDSPAAKAGVKAGDIVAAVNDEVTVGWTVEQAVEKIRGKKGTQVKITLVREGAEKPIELTITRDTIVIKSVKWEIKEVQAENTTKKIIVIKINEFGDNTEPLFNQAVQEAIKNNVSGIVLDVRNNPGGYLQTSVDLASAWLAKDSLVVSEVKSDGTSTVFKAKGLPRLMGIKTVVLINGGSASASEILAGALKDNGAASLIGEKSFGKGSVQELVDLPGGSAVKITVAKWVTPSGKNLNKNGLDPDIELKLTEENTKDGKDPQMEKAIEEITSDK